MAKGEGQRPLVYVQRSFLRRSALYAIGFTGKTDSITVEKIWTSDSTVDWKC
jgi:hypothetical protein